MKKQLTRFQLRTGKRYHEGKEGTKLTLPVAFVSFNSFWFELPCNAISRRGREEIDACLIAWTKQCIEGGIKLEVMHYHQLAACDLCAARTKPNANNAVALKTFSSRVGPFPQEV